MQRFLAPIFLWFMLSACHTTASSSQGILPNYSLTNTNPKQYTISQWQQMQNLSIMSQQKVRLMSFNILFDINDHKMDDEDHHWPARFPRVIQTISMIAPDVLAIQESQVNQSQELNDALKSDFDFISSNATLRLLDKKENFDPGIFYRRSRLELIDSQILFASPTPKEPSKFEGLRFPQTMQVAKFRDKKTKKSFGIIALHMDFFSATVRELTANQVCSIVNSDLATMPVVVMGDFNLFPNRPDLGLPFYDGEFIENVLAEECKLRNSKNIAAFGHTGPIATFTSTEKNPSKPFSGMGVPGIMLDKIFVNRDVRVLGHGTFAHVFDGNLYASDHFPIFADIVLSGK